MSSYRENVNKWRELTDIDYYTYFTKAWIHFNAWYKSNFPSLHTDREVINAIKDTDGNRFKTKFIKLLQGSHAEGERFQSYISQLHYSLSNTNIICDGGLAGKHTKDAEKKKISFESVIVEVDKDNLNQHQKHSGINYYVDIKIEQASRIKSVQATIKNAKGETVLNYQNDNYDEKDLEDKLGSNDHSVSQVQKQRIAGLLRLANPFKPTNLLQYKQNDFLQVGDLKLVNDKNLIARALIEILYNLRNSLFHGSVIPDKTNNLVYESAYKILKTVLDTLD